MDARNAAMRDQVDSLLAQFDETTTRLREAQTAAAAVTVTVTSEDGLVTATVDPSGAPVDLRFASHAFDRVSPAALARSVLGVVRQAGMRAKREVAELMAPLGAGLPDLSDLVEGAPSLKALLPDLSVPEEPPAEDEDDERPLRSEHRPRQVRDDSEDEDGEESIFGGGR
jgi:DNA-binding protein YbaB